MNLMVCDNIERADVETEAKLVGVLEQLELDFEIIKCYGCDRFCVHSNRR